MKKLILAVVNLWASFCHALIDKFKYDLVDDFYEGLAVVKLNGKRYLINTKGNKIKEVE